MKLTIYRDNTTTIRCQALHDDGTPVLLTGCTITMCIKTDQAQPNSSALITKSTASGISIVDSVNGIFTALLNTADTQSLKDTTFCYLDFLIVDPSLNAFTIANNTTLEIKANFTRA